MLYLQAQYFGKGQLKNKMTYKKIFIVLYRITYKMFQVQIEAEIFQIL